jgi:Replication-relaxation
MSEHLPEQVAASELPTNKDVAPRLRAPYAQILQRVRVTLDELPTGEPPLHSIYVPRVAPWTAPPVPRAFTATASQKDCAFCNASPAIQSLAWHAYGVDKDVTAAVRAAQDAGLEEVTPALAKRHFPNHTYEQPAPVRRYKNEEMIEMGEALKAREKSIIMAVYRQRVLLSRQLTDLFFSPETSNDNSATKSAYRFLNELRFKHFLYQYRSRSRGNKTEVYYFLGRYSAPWIEQQEGRIIVARESAYVTSHAQINEFMMEHDIKAADVFVKMRKQLYTNRNADNLVRVNSERLPLHMNEQSWHGARSLSFVYHNPITNSEGRIIPDGFATISVKGADVRSQLPFFYEWDSGSKVLDETVGQIVNYVGFALSGVISQRFPQLTARGYFPPVVWVTSSSGRAHRLAVAAREALKRFGEASIPMMLITDVETMSEHAFADGVWHVIHPHAAEGDRNLVELLVQGNERLLADGASARGRPRRRATCRAQTPSDLAAKP